MTVEGAGRTIVESLTVSPVLLCSFSFLRMCWIVWAWLHQYWYRTCCSQLPTLSEIQAKGLLDLSGFWMLWYSIPSMRSRFCCVIEYWVSRICCLHVFFFFFSEFKNECMDHVDWEQNTCRRRTLSLNQILGRDPICHSFSPVTKLIHALAIFTRFSDLQIWKSKLSNLRNVVLPSLSVSQYSLYEGKGD